MYQDIEALARLIRQIAEFPGFGKKSATRLAFYLLQQPQERIKELSSTLLEVAETVSFCQICCNITDQNPCKICSHPNRDQRLICVVEDPSVVEVLEQTGEYKGRYHVLHGVIAPLKGKGPEHVTIAELQERLRHEPVEEVILATDFDVEGNTTALYIHKLLAKMPVKISRIAQGVPVGASLEYADKVTLGVALDSRKQLQ
jgi:recombination protein RecR